MDEVECEKWKEGTFKTLVSGNGIGINRKHLSVLNYHSKAKWIISSNSAPFYRDKSGGVARRLSIVEWANVIPEKDRVEDFSRKLLEEEGQLFLDWMLEGARRVVARGRFMADHELPEAARAYKQAVIHNADSIAAGPTPTGCCSVPPLAVSNGKASRPSMPAMWLVREEGL